MPKVMTLLLKRPPAGAGTAEKPLMVEVGSLDGDEAVTALNMGYRVISLEGSPRNYRDLMATHGDKTGIHFLQMAASNESGVLHFCVTPDATPFNDHLMTGPHAHCPGTAHNVTTVTLDDLLRNETAIHLLKVDTEGYDGRVLLGATKLFERRAISNVMIEFNPKWMRRRAGIDALKVLQWLACWGFALHPLKAHSSNAHFRSHLRQPGVMHRAIAGGAAHYVQTLEHASPSNFHSWSDIVGVMPPRPSGHATSEAVAPAVPDPAPVNGTETEVDAES
eukprot:EG_transcript_13102